LAVRRDLAWVPVLAANRENLEMSKNNCESTLFAILVNLFLAKINAAESAVYKASTGRLTRIGAAGYESAISMRV
jgi:hypothetical protein